MSKKDGWETCTWCGEVKGWPEGFYWYKDSRYSAGGRYASHCKDCHLPDMRRRLQNMSEEDRAVYLARMRERNMLRQFGLTPEKYDSLFERQGGLCAICRQPETSMNSQGTGVKRLAVDHDHETNTVRGLLCMKRNTRLGYFEKFGLLDAVVDYVSNGGVS